ncbi:metallophosphoesterase [Candidatus Uabimicrobium sp. HlEnr_7]|uniref:metallophosphoesterase family protein n=1 Tax=Candidatus Uabimicrobium helgolandensis TaxID=3095367 RepID=UPI003558F15B
MTKYAVLSDIHANLAALDVVLDDIDERNIEEIIVLGDVIGYGPSPRECWKEISEQATFILIGDHEQDVISNARPADEMAAWTAKKMKNLDSWDAFARMTKTNLTEHAQKIYEGNFFVHAAPKNTTKERIWPGYEDFYISYNSQLDKRLQGFMNDFPTDHGFFGHTHIPTVMTGYENCSIFDTGGPWNKELTFIGPNSIFYVPKGNTRIDNIEGKLVFINPGSVGQPKDGDNRACYAIYDENSIEFIRLEYDIEETKGKLEKLSVDKEITSHLSERLQKGL